MSSTYFFENSHGSACMCEDCVSGVKVQRSGWAPTTKAKQPSRLRRLKAFIVDNNAADANLIGSLVLAAVLFADFVLALVFAQKLYADETDNG